MRNLVCLSVAIAIALLSVTLFSCATSAQENASPKVRIEEREGADALDVVINGEPFTTYYYSNDAKKPYLWPILAEGGVTLTRDYPMEKTGTSTDHIHQKSFWTAYGDVNGTDCWAEGEGSGFQQSGDVTFESGDEQGFIRAKNTWLDKDRKPVLTEQREYRFLATPASARIFDVKVTFTADYGDVLFKDTKEGGIVALRMRDDLTEKTNGKMTLDGGRSGMDSCWGKPSPWCDYSGPIEGAGVRGITVFDHPGNLRHPTRWHVRDYGLLGANCFGLSYFTEKEAEKLNGDYTLKQGETLTFNYRIYVHSGDVNEAKVAERYAEYAKQ